MIHFSFLASTQHRHNATFSCRFGDSRCMWYAEISDTILMVHWGGLYKRSTPDTRSWRSSDYWIRSSCPPLLQSQCSYLEKHQDKTQLCHQLIQSTRKPLASKIKELAVEKLKYEYSRIKPTILYSFMLKSKRLWSCYKLVLLELSRDSCFKVTFF